MRIKKVTIRPVGGKRLKAVARVRFDNGCEMSDVRVMTSGTEYVVGVPWKRPDVRRCVKAGRLAAPARKAVREEVMNEYIHLLARDEAEWADGSEE